MLSNTECSRSILDSTTRQTLSVRHASGQIRTLVKNGVEACRTLSVRQRVETDAGIPDGQIDPCKTLSEVGVKASEINELRWQ